MTEKIQWNPSLHAVQRLKERLGVAEASAKNFVNQLMQTANYVTTSKDGCDTYHHEKRNVFIVVDAINKIIVTVYPPVIDDKPTFTIERISNAIKREFNRMKTQLSREVRKMTEQQAQLNVQMAELSLNKIRCYHPPTQALIQSRIDLIKSQVSELATEIDVKLTQIQQAADEVKAVVGE